LHRVFTECYLLTASDCSCSHRRTNGRRTFSIFANCGPGQLPIESEHTECNSVAVLGKILGRGLAAGPSSFGRQQRLSEITIEPIKNLGAWARFGGLCPLAPT